MNTFDVERLTSQFTRLPVEREAEVLDFVQFLVHKEPERQQLTQAASRLSESTLAAIWENADDAAYDQL